MDLFKKVAATLFPALAGATILLGPGILYAYDYKSEKILSPAPLFAKNGIVSASHPIATEVGISILQKGGNAFDAAVGTALALSAVDMAMSGPGGGELLASLGRQGKEAPQPGR